MALTPSEKGALKNAIAKFNTELEVVGEDLCRIKLLAGLQAGWPANVKPWSTTYYNAVKRGGGGTPEKGKAYLDSIKEQYIKDNTNAIDPGTVYEILNGVMWPSIAEQDTALVDHPSDPLLTTMRGVPASAFVVLQESFLNQNTFDLKRLSVTFLGSERLGNSTIANTSPEYKAACTTLWRELEDALVAVINPNGLSDLDVKFLVSEFFKTEVAAKLYWITWFGNNPRLGWPVRTIANLNAYLGYFNWTVGWLGGDNSLDERGIQAEYRANGFSSFPFDSNKFVFDNTSTSHDVKSVGATVKAINANYKWLQAQKTSNDNKDYYQQWFNRFLSVPKSLVNMLVILNERVHLNAGKEFTYSAATTQRLAAMGAAYQGKFEIELGD